MRRQHTFEYQNVKVWFHLFESWIARSTGKRLHLVDNVFGVPDV